jgi:adenosine deaminase
MTTATKNLLSGTDIVIESLPKVSLHDHLDGGLRPQTIIDLAGEIGFELPEADAPALATWFARKCDSGSLVEYLTTFDITTAVMQTRAGLERVARECVLDLAADGVMWGEIRWAPEQHLTAGLSLDDAVEAVQSGLDAGVEQAKSAGHSIRVGQLITAMRHADRALEVAQLALRHRNNGVVGFDIAGAEAGFPASRMVDAFDLLAANFFPVTIHAGEADGLESIRSALLDGRALRLGHGVRLAEDVDLRGEGDTAVATLGVLAAWVKDRHIALEVSPSSNLQTGAIAAWGDTMAEHPLDLFYQMGFSVTINTDNRLMSATTLSRELRLVADAFEYDLDDLLALQLNAAQAAFLPVEEREALMDTIIDGFEAAS